MAGGRRNDVPSELISDTVAVAADIRDKGGDKTDDCAGGINIMPLEDVSVVVVVISLLLAVVVLANWSSSNLLGFSLDNPSDGKRCGCSSNERRPLESAGKETTEA
jgi:hypothetical protein